MHSLTLDDFPYKKIQKAYLLKDGASVSVKLKNKNVVINIPDYSNDEQDLVIVLNVK